MKNLIFLVSLGLLLLSLTTSCGYRNPYVYSGPDRTIYVTSWKNRTSELQLDSKIYQSLLKWFQKSDSLSVVNKKDGADFILAGEIISIDLPSLSFGASSTTKEVKLKLKVRYILKDINNGKVLIEEPGEFYTEEYSVSSDSSTTSDNEKLALETTIDDLSQAIYLGTLSKLSKL